MKKSYCLAMLMLIPLVLFSCSVKNIVPFETKKEAKLYMTAKMDDVTFGADFSYYPDRTISIDFNEPEMLDGLNIRTDITGFSVDAYGIKDTIEYEELTDDAFLSILVKSVQKAVFDDNQEYEELSDSDGRKIDFNISGISVTAGFDRDGFIKSIDVPSIGFNAQFTVKADG